MSKVTIKSHRNPSTDNDTVWKTPSLCPIRHAVNLALMNNTKTSEQWHSCANRRASSDATYADHIMGIKQCAKIDHNYFHFNIPALYK